MTYISDQYGDWKFVAEITISNDEVQIITVPSNVPKVIRWTFTTDWTKWNSPIYRTKALLRWHYGNSNDLIGNYFSLFPKQESILQVYDLFSVDSLLVPRKLEVKRAFYRRRYYNVEPVSWTLKIEEYERG